MKEKVLFIAAMVGSFSAAIVLLLNNVLEILGVEAGGYVDIINIVGTALALIILVVGVFFLNKYSVEQQKATVAQNATINTALNGSSELINTLLPKLAGDILDTAEKRGQALLKDTQTKVDQMMNEMLPELAKQTMQLVTEQSQNIVEETTAKANDTMQKMDELIPTYAKHISDQVAQTVRENNAHYHKMLTELKGLVKSIPQSAPVDDVSEQLNKQLTEVNSLSTNLENKITTLNQDINDKLEAMALAISSFKVPEPEPIITTVGDAQPEPEYDVNYITETTMPIKDPMPVYETTEEALDPMPVYETTEEAINKEVIEPEESVTQNEDNSLKSDETKTE